MVTHKLGVDKGLYYLYICSMQKINKIMNVKLLNENPYQDIICRFFSQQLPKIFKPNKDDLLEIITDLLVSTKENRYGSIPKPESLVKIREVIRTSIQNGTAIPILVPWGGVKSNYSEHVPLDIAEIGAIMQLVHLDNAIKEIWYPGLHINIRIEDTGAYWLYRKDHDKVAPAIHAYQRDFEKLVYILGDGHNIVPIAESSRMIYDEYYHKSSEASTLIYKYILHRDMYPNEDPEHNNHYIRLKEIGWVGYIPKEQQNYYIDRYKNLYPNLDYGEYVEMLSDYLGGAWARYQLNGRCEPMPDFIQITFVPPVQGAPASIFNNTLYWRSLPVSNSRSHIAPWRAQGYLRIDGNEVKMKITETHNQTITDQLTPDILYLSHKGIDVNVRANYLIEN